MTFQSGKNINKDAKTEEYRDKRTRKMSLAGV